MPKKNPTKLKAGLLRELAVKASVHPDTIQKAFEGKPVRGIAGDRARAILKGVNLIDHDAPEPR